MKKITLIFSAFLFLNCLWFTSCEDKNRNVIALWEEEDNGGGGPVEVPDLYDSERPVAIAEQAGRRIIIVDSLSKGIMWEWKVSESSLSDSRRNWFSQLDEVKPVYGLKYILTTSSSGGVALIRIEDKQIVFYANPGGSPHSAEILPDGNIVVASSTTSSPSATSDMLLLYKFDPAEPYVASPAAQYPLEFGHNAVWDRQRQLLWATANDKLFSYTYNFDMQNPALTATASYDLPGTEAHDMFPVYGQDKLWLTTVEGIYIYDIASDTFSQPPFSYRNIKSITSGPKGFATILQRPTESYWADEVIDSAGLRVYYEAGTKIYKARWFIDNPFSYEEGQSIPE